MKFDNQTENVFKLAAIARGFTKEQEDAVRQLMSIAYSAGRVSVREERLKELGIDQKEATDGTVRV